MNDELKHDDALLREIAEAIESQVPATDDEAAVERALDEAARHSAPLSDDRVRRIMNLMHTEDPSMSRSQSVAARSSVASASVSPATGKPRETEQGTYYAAAVVAAALLVGIGMWLGGFFGPGGNRERHGDSRPIAENDVKTPSHRELDVHAVKYHSPKSLVARERPTVPAAPIAVGDTLTTGHGELRRAALPDSSIVYVNENTKLTVKAARRLELAAGEAFIEVAAARNEASGERESFVVATPDREVTALGTKFAVTRADNVTRVLVTQGKVAVSGVEQALTAGQQLLLKGEDADAPPEITAAERASHLLAWTRDLLAAAESPLVPGSEHSGGALIAVDPYGDEAKLSLRKYHVDVHIEDGFARTTIDQTYFNHYSWRLEGTFYFPLPPDASLSRLAMYIGPKLMEGGMAEREHARNVFEEIRYTQRDPALLEWVDGSTFKMRVFPLEGRQEKRILISYTQKLPTSYGESRYRFPAGHSLDVVRDWSVNVRVKNGGKLHWESPSHELTAKQDGDDLLITGEARGVKLDKDLVITLQHGSGSGSDSSAPVRFQRDTLDGKQFLAVRIRPELPTAPNREHRNWVLLFESSGDRDPLLARVQIDILRTLLENAEHDDTFSLVTAATRVGVYNDEPLPCTPENIAAAVEFLDHVHLVGALDLSLAFQACAPLARAGENSHLVHIGSGVPILGQREQKPLLDLLPEGTKYVGIGVGKRWGRALMKEAARRTGGYFTQINPDEPATWRTFALLSTLNAPRLLDVNVASNDDTWKFLPLADSIVDGDELLAVARADVGESLPRSVTLRGTFEGQLWKTELPVLSVEEQAGFLPRTWAKQEIDRLVAEGAEANKANIVELSKSTYVMSPFTSLLVLESEEMYERFKVDRGRKDHWAMYAAPDTIEVVHEPLTGPQPKPEPASDAAREEESRPSPERVLKTVQFRTPVPILFWPNRPFHGYQVLDAWQMYTGAFAWGYMPTNYYNYFGRFENLQILDEDINGSYDYTDFESTLLGVDDLKDRISGRMYVNGRFDFGLLPPRLFDEEIDLRRPMLGTNWRIPSERLSESTVWRWGYPGYLGWGKRRLDFTDGEWDESLLGPQTWTRPGPKLHAMNLPYNWYAGGLPGLRGVDGKTGTLLLSEDLSGEQFNFGYLDLYRGDFSARIADGGFWYGNDVTEPAFALNDLVPTARHAAPRNLIERLLWSMQHGTQQQVAYQHPYFSGSHTVFNNLLAFAPGMNTDDDDVRAVLEAEAQAERPPRIGAIDEAARKLIERARRPQWEAIRVTKSGEFDSDVELLHDHAGRYVVRRSVNGLGEEIVCDGETLWHLYLELGVGAKRTVSRFHRSRLTAMAPWTLPPADDLAYGADVRFVDENTVAIVPLGRYRQPAEATSSETSKSDDAKTPHQLVLHLVFNKQTGRLAERHVFDATARETLLRKTFAADGKIELLDKDGESLANRTLPRKPAAAPSLDAESSGLVVLPLPYRTQQHLFKTNGRQDNGKYADWSDADAYAMLAAKLNADETGMRQLIAQRFFARGDRRIGFYTLLLTGGWSSPGEEIGVAGGKRVRFDPLADHPESPLARYVALVEKSYQTGKHAAEAVEGPSSSFIVQLAEFRRLYYDWSSGRANNGKQVRESMERDTFAYINGCPHPDLAWALTTTVLNYGGTNKTYDRVQQAMPRFFNVPHLAYYSRYEQARALQHASRNSDSAKRYAEAYELAFKAGVLPPIDGDFRAATQSGGEGAESWSSYLRQTADHLLAKDHAAAVVYLALQCQQAGDSTLAEELLSAALAQTNDENRLAVQLFAIEYLWQSGQLPRAEAIIAGMLETERLADEPTMWRLGSWIAAQNGKLALSLSRRERAMELEYRELPAMINLQAVRNDYSQLLDEYQQLANAIVTLENEPPADFVDRVVAAADRWRSLDPDDTQASQSAANILTVLGRDELAWDYLTTPLADKPNEAAPWQSMATNLRQRGEFELAAKAYALACEAEPTNAQNLWDHAQLLMQSGRQNEARQLLVKLAHSDWQPRFNWVKQQAQRYLGESP